MTREAAARCLCFLARLLFDNMITRNWLLAARVWQGKAIKAIALLAAVFFATAAAGAGPVFVTSEPNGGWANGGYYVHNNMWNHAKYHPCVSTLSAWAYNNWRVVTRMDNRSGDGAVKTYPNVHKDYRSLPVSSLESLTSEFAETSPGAGIYDVAYDVWLNGVATPGCTEIMIWNDNCGQTPGGRFVQEATFDGRSFKIYKTPSNGYIALVAGRNFHSGNMNLLQIIKWVQAKGWLSDHATLDQICFGVEVVSTDDADAVFSVSAFSINEGYGH